MSKTTITAIMALVLHTILISGCSHNRMLRESLTQAGSNRPELERVLEHYASHPEKLAAARFLIENMPAHYSYSGDSIYTYYSYADAILSHTTLTPEQQRDSLLFFTQNGYRSLTLHTIPDSRIITADFLIQAIDASFHLWKNCPWASHITFDEYLEWLLPYKAVEYQELDSWRDTLYTHFSYGLTHPIKNDVECNTTTGIADMIRSEVQSKVNRYGLYTPAGLPLLSDKLLHRQTFGNIPDYALLGTLAFRSMGIPTVIDETPVGPRHTAATRWFTVLMDRGDEQPSEWDLSTSIGNGFFPYERGPKVFRISYAIDKERYLYKKRAKYIYPFDLGVKDVTANYFRTSDIKISIPHKERRKLKDRYVYIASSLTQEENSYTISPEDKVIEYDWKIVDFGKLRGGKACFSDMGREVLYNIYGFDGTGLTPLVSPFILHKDGSIEYVSMDTVRSVHLDKWRNQPLNYLKK